MGAGRLYTTKEVARLTGVQAATLRKWEERYHLVSPQRLPNGYRGYTEQDVALLRHVGAQVASGAPISRVVEELRHRPQPAEAPVTTGSFPEQRARLLQHLTTVDEAGARRALDEFFALFQVETVLQEILVPALHEIGHRWAAGAISEYQEHFASVVIRDRLSTLRALQPTGHWPRLITACVPGELHEIGALIISILALRRGCHVTHLSGSPSPEGLCRAVAQLEPEAVMLSATTPENLLAALPAIAKVAAAAGQLRRPARVLVGGQGVQQTADLPTLPGVTFTSERAEAALAALTAPSVT